MTGLKALHLALEQREKFERYAEHIGIRRRIALRLGLLELYADYTRIMIMLTEPPFAAGENHSKLAGLNFELGECCRVAGKNESAVEYFNEVRKHTFDQNGQPYDRRIYEGI